MKNKINGDETISPQLTASEITGHPYSVGGLTIRQHFAAMAMQGIISNSYKESEASNWLDIAVEHSVKIADALINELNK